MSPVSEWQERKVQLAGRGETFVRDSVGPPGAPTLFLLHGLAATGLLNWRPALAPLARSYRVVVVDHRGHGRGVQIREPFRLADCADDAAAISEALEIDDFFAVGYSMGGPIAQLLWRRHRQRIRGLVLCATACRFASDHRRRMSFAFSPALNAAGRIAPRALLQQGARRWISSRIEDPRIRDWVIAEAGSSDPMTVSQAAAAILRFDSSSWASEIDVPTSVVLTERDELVPARSQRAMADAIPGAIVYGIAGRHSVCVAQPRLFVPSLEAACASVVRRAHRKASRG